MKCKHCGQFHPEDWTHDQKAKYHVGAKLAKYTAKEDTKPRQTLTPKEEKKK